MSPCCSFGRDVRIRKVLSKINQDPAINVQSLARLVKLSSSRLGHLFKADTGMELRHFLVESRLEKAIELLRNTDMQIKEISHIVGYQHVPSFDRVFRRRFNVSPADYRRHEPIQETQDFATLLPEVTAQNGTAVKAK
jgi:AraC family transcriptional regulator, arabinose operon regulatory protein